MTATLIKGAEVAAQIREELQKEIAELKDKHNVVPGLVTVLVGADPASQVYVGQKEKTSKELGIYSERYDLPAETTQEELLKLIDKLNKDPKINGILVQLPLPKHLNEEEVLIAIDPRKDVDGFHPVNVGKLMIGEPDYLPCTPAGIQQLLIHSGTQIRRRSGHCRQKQHCRQTHRQYSPPESPGSQCHGHHLPYQNPRY